MELISSRDNQTVKELVALLTHKKARDKAGRFALEGARLCIDALESGSSVSVLLLTPIALQQYPHLEPLLQHAERVVWLEPGLAARIGDTNTPQGVFAICAKLDNGASAVTIENNGRYLLLAGLQDPGNLGTCLRTAYALGVNGAFVSGCPDLYAPKVIRAGMGASLRLPVSIWSDAQAMILHLRDAGVAVYAAALTRQALHLGKVEFTGSCAVLIGNEGSGLPEELVQACNNGVMIPMQEGAESLNAASAASVLLWEMTRQRLSPLE